MGKKSYLAEQLELVDSIIKMTDSLIPVLKNEDRLNNTIQIAVSEIFRYFALIIKLMPDILVLNNIKKNAKDNLDYSLFCVRLSWGLFTIDPEDFFEEWNRLVVNWKEYKQVITELDNSPDTLFLSMN